MTQQTEQRTVYVGSLWHQNCDPFMSVVGFDANKVEAKLEELAQEEFNRCTDQDAAGDLVFEDDIMGGGVFPEPLFRLVDFIEDSNRLDEYMADLESDGIAII